MSLDVYVKPTAEMPRIGDDYEYICSMEDDGYFTFLHPLFEALGKETGEYIDPYGGARFKGETLNALSRTLSEARQLVDKQPEAWEHVIKYLERSTPKESRSKVEKQQMIQLLNKLEEAVVKAQARSQYVVFFGD
jgi:uncharacterized coiled-coil protein SlyX